MSDHRTGNEICSGCGRVLQQLLSSDSFFFNSSIDFTTTAAAAAAAAAVPTSSRKDKSAATVAIQQYILDICENNCIPSSIAALTIRHYTRRKEKDRAAAAHSLQESFKQAHVPRSYCGG